MFVLVNALELILCKAYINAVLLLLLLLLLIPQFSTIGGKKLIIENIVNVCP